MNTESNKNLFPVYEVIRPTCYCMKEFPDAMHSFQGKDDFDLFAKKYNLEESHINIVFPDKDIKKEYEKYPACCRLSLLCGYFQSISKEILSTEASSFENKLNRKLPHSLPGPLKQRKQIYWVN